MIQERMAWLVLWSTTVLSIVGCSATNTADKSEKPTSADDPKSLYSIPKWHEPLERFNDAANAKDSQDALKDFAEFADATTGAQGKIAANLEAERTWSATVNKVATQNGDIERAVSLVSAETTWSHVRDRVYEIVSVPPAEDKIDKRIQVRLDQLAVIREVMDRWAEYENKQIEKANKALTASRGYLDNARKLKLPEIVWQNYAVDQEKSQEFVIDFSKMVPAKVKVSKVTPTTEAPNEESLEAKAGEGDDDAAVLTVTIKPKFEGPADVKVAVSYEVDGAAAPEPAITTIRFFTKDAAQLAWDRFSGAVIEASQQWIKLRLAGAKDVKALSAVQQRFVNALLAVADNELKEAARKFLDDNLPEPEDGESAKEFRELLVDVFSDALADARRKREERGNNDEKRAAKKQNLREAFEQMIAEDDPRQAIGPIVARGTDPVAVYSLVAALREGLGPKDEALLNSYLEHLKTQFESAEKDGPPPPSTKLRNAKSQLEGLPKLQDYAERLNARYPSAKTSAARKEKGLDADAPVNAGLYDGGFTKRLGDAVLVVKNWSPPVAGQPGGRQFKSLARERAARPPVVAAPPAPPDPVYVRATLKMGTVARDTTPLGASPPTDRPDAVASTEAYVPWARRERAVLVLLPALGAEVKRLRYDVADSAESKGAATPKSPSRDPLVDNRDIGELLVESAVPLEALSFAGSVTEDQKVKTLIGVVRAKVAELGNNRRDAYIRLAQYIVELQEIRLAALQENQRHVGTLTGVLDAEIKRWDLVREQARRFKRILDESDARLKREEKDNSATILDDYVMNTLRRSAIAARETQRDPRKDFDDAAAEQLRGSVAMINAFLAVGAINERLGLQNRLDVKSEVKLHDVTLQSLALRPEEADIRYLLREQSELMASGVTSQNLFDTLQTGLLGWIAGKQ